MNALNLRISSIKLKDRKQKSVCAQTELVIPTDAACATAAGKKFILQTTVQQQIVILQKFFQQYNNNNNSNDNEDAAADRNELLQFLADIYFQAPLKHPVRNLLKKFFISKSSKNVVAADANAVAADANAVAAAAAVVYVLEERMAQLITKTLLKSESDDWNMCIMSLSDCFDNFPCGLKALENQRSKILHFLIATLEKYFAELVLLATQAPSARMLHLLFVHNAIRLTLHCAQPVTLQLTTEHIALLQQMRCYCKQIIANDEMPMDIRTNCGNLLTQIAKCAGADQYNALLQNMKVKKASMQDLPLLVGIVITCQDDRQFQQHANTMRILMERIFEIVQTNGNIPSVLLCAARAQYYFAKLLQTLQLQQDATTAVLQAKLILRQLLLFNLNYMEHPMDSVRHLCRDSLRHVLATARQLKFQTLLHKVYEACNSMSQLSLPMTCLILQQATFVLGAEEILQNCAQLCNQLLYNHLDDYECASVFLDLFETLMLYSHKEKSFDEWSNFWIKKLLQLAILNDERLPNIETLLIKAVKYEPAVMNLIMEKQKCIPDSTKLSILLSMRRNAAASGGGGVVDHAHYKNQMPEFNKLLMHSVLSSCDDTRLMALQLLVESPKSNELLTQFECQHLLTFVEYNCNCANAGTRQKMLHLLSKALKRCELNLKKLLRQQRKNCKDDEVPFVQEFLINFLQILLDNLFDGASYNRRVMALHLLQQCLHVYLSCELPLSGGMQQLLMQRLVHALADTYEGNKVLALQMLLLLQKNGVAQGLKLTHMNLPSVLLKLQSVRPAECMTGAYQLKYLLNHMPMEAFVAVAEEEVVLPVVRYAVKSYVALHWLLCQLQKAQRLAEMNIMEVAKQNPLYGSLFAIKLLLEDLHFEQMADCKHWRQLIAEVILLCMQLSHSVSSIVNNCSPEGYLPADAAAAADNNDNVHAQMLLLCAWRTIKEVSAVLGHIMLYAPLHITGVDAKVGNFVINQTQLQQVGRFFKQLLTQLKHRGAFEQAFLGYSKLCCRLWRHECMQISQLPMQWLQKLLKRIFDNNENAHLCATRRSAGVPFMLQALIISELQMGTSKALTYAMLQLIAVCKHNNNAADVASSTTARTHALNILRALFRCSDLNEVIGEFIAAGIVCAINSFDANNWSERNAATLLFSALVIRIFGVQRSKDADCLNIRNKMTGRIFFLRYPKLFDFFLLQLQQATTEIIQQQQRSNKLHALLLILGRLYPSALEGSETNLMLSQFIPYIDQCLCAAEMRTRYLAAKAINALIAKDDVPATILQKCAQLFLHSNPAHLHLLHNALHGNLMQILMLLKTHKLQDADLLCDIIYSLTTLHETTQLSNGACLKLILDILTEIYINTLHCQNNIKLTDLAMQQLAYFQKSQHQQQFAANDFSLFYAPLRTSFFIYNLYVRQTIDVVNVVDYLVSTLQQTSNLECLELSLNVILLLLLSSTKTMCCLETADFVAEFEISTEIVQFVDFFMLQVPNAADIVTALDANKCLQHLLQESLAYPQCARKSYVILSMLTTSSSTDHFTLQQLLQESRKHADDFKLAFAVCIAGVLLQQRQQHIEMSIANAEICLQFLDEISTAWHADILRLAATQILAHLSTCFVRAMQQQQLHLVRMFIKTILTLLMDDCVRVRNQISAIILNMQSCNKTFAKNMQIVSSMALQVFLQMIIDLLLEIHADAAAADNIATADSAAAAAADDFILKIIKTICQQQYENDQQNAEIAANYCDEPFLSSEVNSFADPAKVILDFAHLIKKLPCKEQAIMAQLLNKVATKINKKL